MLALTRRIGEEVVIGDPRNPLGVIRIMEIHGDKVRLSFDFPKDMPINRRELAEQKARQHPPDHPDSPGTPGTPGSPGSSSSPGSSGSSTSEGYSNPGHSAGPENRTTSSKP